MWALRWGGLGSDAAIEAADVVLMDDKPSKIAVAIRQARRTLRIARENTWFADWYQNSSAHPRFLRTGYHVDGSIR